MIAVNKTGHTINVLHSLRFAIRRCMRKEAVGCMSVHACMIECMLTQSVCLLLSILSIRLSEIGRVSCEVDLTESEKHQYINQQIYMLGYV